MTASSKDIISSCNDLKKYWDSRDKKFEEWYDEIRMVDTLAAEGMESFVGNDPRAAFNLLLGMLSQKIPHRIPPEQLSREQISPASELSRTFEIIWNDIVQSYRLRGRYFYRDLIGFLLATGWYSVFAIVSADGSKCVADVLNPATVFPFWDDTMIECAHIFRLSETQAKRMAFRNNWQVSNQRGAASVYDYWKVDGDKVVNSIVLGNTVVKDSFWEPRLKRIPIFVAPVGGLPDTGVIHSKGEDWKKELGQSFLSPNENIYKYWNKWWTFSMQLLRDTAQARTYEKSASGKTIIDPKTFYKRGGHYKMGPQDEIGFMEPPPIPVELRSTQLDMEAMMQRGGPSWAMYGNIQQQLTAYVMSQIAASANQITKPYHQGIIDCLTDIDNFFFNLIKDNNYKVYGREFPKELPDDATITAEYELRIPGDLIQRVTTARIMNPAFELSDEKVMEECFPEIKNPAEEIAKVMAGKARRNPINSQIALVDYLKQQAELLRKYKNPDAARLYEKAAANVESTLSLEESGTGATGERGVRPPTPRPEVSPPAGSQPIVPTE
jgi:hypothetical protein